MLIFKIYMKSKKNNKNQVHRKIKQKIGNNLKKIEDGYRIVWQEQDGCDQYGLKYWVDCDNGFSGRSWEIQSSLSKDIRRYLINIIENGIYYKGHIYYIEYTQFPNITVYNKLKFINKQQYKKQNQSKEIRSVLTKLLDFLNNFAYCRKSWMTLNHDYVKIKLNCYQSNKIDVLQNTINKIRNILDTKCLYNKLGIFDIYHDIYHENINFLERLKQTSWYKYIYYLDLTDKEKEIFETKQKDFIYLPETIRAINFKRNDNLYTYDNQQNIYCINWLNFLDKTIGIDISKTYLAELVKVKSHD